MEDGRGRSASVTKTVDAPHVPYICFLLNVGANAPLVRQRRIAAASRGTGCIIPALKESRHEPARRAHSPPEGIGVTYVLLALLAGAVVYSLLSVVAALRYLSVRPPALNSQEPISILKPLAGLDLGLESNLRTFFEQDYPAFEILFAVEVRMIRRYQLLKVFAGSTREFLRACW